MLPSALTRCRRLGSLWKEGSYYCLLLLLKELRNSTPLTFKLVSMQAKLLHMHVAVVIQDLIRE